jgi:hypothetical protein
VQAELVAFRVMHDERQRTAIAVRLDQLCTKAYQPFNLGLLAFAIDVDVEVYAILGNLAFGDTLKEESRLDAGRIAARRHVAERRAAIDHDPVICGHASIGHELVNQLRVILHGGAEHLAPESGLGMRVGTVERHLGSHDGR